MSAIEMGPAKFMQKVLKIAEEVNRFFDVSLFDSATNSADRIMLDRIAQDAGKQREMKAKYAAYVTATGGKAKKGKAGELQA
jgi:hypothetical protein